jgi:hypothetical protein
VKIIRGIDMKPRSDAMNFLNCPTRTQLQTTVRFCAPSHELALVPLDLVNEARDADDFSRCGWFDSSLELAHGLEVIEHLDSLPDGLPLLAAR